MDELAYHKQVGENRQIFKIDLASQQSQQLTRRGINVYPDWVRSSVRFTGFSQTTFTYHMLGKSQNNQLR